MKGYGIMKQHIHRVIAVLTLFAVPVTAALASDVAQFTNLGFSPDSRVFMFAQYGITSDSSHPYADIFTVDVPANAFIAAGLESEEYAMAISAGQDGRGALFSLLPELRPVIERYGISHLRQGRLVYLYVNGEEEPREIAFRDFDSGDRYTISMTQSARGSGMSGSAAFHLDVVAQYADGTLVEERVGRPGFFRDGVNRYRIAQVIASPDGRSLVAVVERITDTGSGQRIRYMVETVRLR